MPNIVVYYHDPVEVDPATSWTGLYAPLQTAQRVDIRTVSDPRVLALFDYTRPDAVITVNGEPVVSIEQTQMNPSGHNIPQRFSFHVRAAELGVPSILYYPEYARRTFSDPNVRYVQVRVPLAQKRLSTLFDIPALSIFWPTNQHTLLPDTKQEAHQEMADVVGALITNAGNKNRLLQLPEVQKALHKMDLVVAAHSREYRQNSSVRRLLPNGFPGGNTKSGISIDPPTKAHLYDTQQFLSLFQSYRATPQWVNTSAQLRTRQYTLVFTGTANSKRNDSEHPWPGYLTLLDVLYTRTKDGRSPTNREVNLVYWLPVDLALFLRRLNQSRPPTPAYIVDSFADLLILNGGVVPGRPMRGNTSASPSLLQ